MELVFFVLAFTSSIIGGFYFKKKINTINQSLIVNFGYDFQIVLMCCVFLCSLIMRNSVFNMESLYEHLYNYTSSFILIAYLTKFLFVLTAVCFAYLLRNSKKNLAFFLLIMSTQCLFLLFIEKDLKWVPFYYNALYISAKEITIYLILNLVSGFAVYFCTKSIFNKFVKNWNSIKKDQQSWSFFYAKFIISNIILENFYIVFILLGVHNFKFFNKLTYKHLDFNIYLLHISTFKQ